MIEYCTKRILTIALVVLVVVASIIFFIEESVNFALRPQRITFGIVNPCTENQSSHYLTSCQLCNQIDMKSDPACKETGHRVRVVCNSIKLKTDDKTEEKVAGTGASKWVSCDPETFSDLQAERRSFIIFEAFVGCCGLAAYLFVRRQHRRLDQRLVDRVNRQILAST